MSEATQYDATHARWKRDPEAYWAEAARGVDDLAELARRSRMTAAMAALRPTPSQHAQT